MESLPLSLKVLLGFLHQAIAGMGEPRKASNATRYSLRDPILGAFSAFFMQCESFLEHQRSYAEPSREKQCPNPIWGH